MRREDGEDLPKDEGAGEEHPTIGSKKNKRRIKKSKASEKRHEDPSSSLWLLDRTRGRSHPDLDSKPPFPCCYVPRPVYRFRCIMEQNIVCETMGRIGCLRDKNDVKSRTRVACVGVVANLIALCITFYACFSICNSFSTIRATSFSRGQVSLLNSTRLVAKIDIGLRGVAFESLDPVNPFRELGEHVITFSSFCDLVDVGLERYMDPDQCQACADASNGLIATLISSLVLVLPNLTTDILRMYPNYDVNCQKFFGTIISFLSMCLSLSTYFQYNAQCFSVFYEGVVPFFLNQTAVNQILEIDKPIANAFFVWGPGPGVICMFIATALKIVDIAAMLTIQTPDITRKHAIQAEYERLYNIEDGAGFDAEGDDGASSEEGLVVETPSAEGYNDERSVAGAQ